MSSTNKSAMSLTRIIDARVRRQIKFLSNESRVGVVVNASGPVIRIGKQNFQRTAYKVAKGVSLRNVALHDEVLMTSTQTGVYILTQILRKTDEDDDNVFIDGNLTVTGTISTDTALVTPNLVINGPLTCGNLTATGNVVLGDSGSDLIGFYGTTPVARITGYTMTNVTQDRTLDANSYTTDEIADVLGTLITDLKTMGLIA